MLQALRTQDSGGGKGHWDMKCRREGLSGTSVLLPTVAASWSYSPGCRPAQLQLGPHLFLPPSPPMGRPLAELCCRNQARPLHMP